MIGIAIAFFASLAAHFKIWKPVPLESIANIVNGKKTFMVFNPINMASSLAKFAFFDYPKPSSGRNFFRFSFEVADEGATTGFAVSLSDLKRLNQEDEFIHIFDGIDKILLENPDLNFY